jgi:hypothetical protein
VKRSKNYTATGTKSTFIPEKSTFVTKTGCFADTKFCQDEPKPSYKYKWLVRYFLNVIEADLNSQRAVFQIGVVPIFFLNMAD